MLNLFILPETNKGVRLILRRISQHVKDQNWFAVALDFVIVVAGILIAFQITVWNEVRKDSAEEQKYLTRLHSDVIDALNTSFNHAALKSKVQNSLRSTLEAFKPNSGIEKLTSQQCASVYFSHIYEAPFPSLPTVSELLSSGRFSVLGSERLRDLLAKHEQTRDGYQRFADGMLVNRIVMAAEHSDLIQIGVEFHNFSSDGSNFFDHISDDIIACDLASMRSDVRFKNNLIDNTARHHEFHRSVAAQYEQLQEIHRELDSVIGLSHGDAMP